MEVMVDFMSLISTSELRGIETLVIDSPNSDLEFVTI